MQWFNNLMAVFSKKADIEAIKQKIYSATEAEKISDLDLKTYVRDIQSRVKNMAKELRIIYKKYGIKFTGFKSFNSACEYLLQSIQYGDEQSYNNLIKLESLVNSEKKGHLTLLRMAMTADGKKLMDQINSDPVAQPTFIKIFGASNDISAVNTDGLYQHLWYEIHKLSEYVLIHKNRVYHSG